MKATFALLAGLTAQQAAATWNYGAKPFKSPQYANNECSDKQKGGFDWSDLKDGDSNFQYGDFDFSGGWKCSNAFGKRDALTKRTFGNKAIVNKCSKNKPASFGCNKRRDGFSITTIDVSVEFDVEVDLHYKMKDGSLCKQKSVPCKKEGNTIKNTQCGGAESVDVYLGGGYKGGKSDCQIGFHHIGFDCNPGKEYTPPPPPSPPSTPSSKPTPSCYGGDCGKPPKSTTKGCEGGYGEGCPPGPTPPGSKPPVQTPPGTTPPGCNGGYGPNCPSGPTPPGSKPPVQTPSSASPPGCNGGYGPGCPSGQTPPGPKPPVETSPPYSNNTTPVPPPTYETTKIPPPGGEKSTATSPSKSSVVPPPPPSKESSVSSCNGGYGSSCETSAAPLPSPPASTPGVPYASPPPSTPSKSPPAPVGDVLPTCMNTWLEISTEDCKDNTAVDCYCKNAKFTKNVIDCVQAWCKTDEETKQTLQYLVGICAQYVPQNPGLVGDCPNDTFQPPSPPSGGAQPPASPPAGGAQPPSSSGAPPANTPAPQPMPAGPVTTIVYSSTTITVPQVHFSTEYPASGSGPQPTTPVGLVAGPVPVQAPANPTAPYPIPSTLVPTIFPTGTGALRPSSPAQFTGAASPFKAEARHVVLGAAIAFFAL